MFAQSNMHHVNIIALQETGASDIQGSLAAAALKPRRKGESSRAGTANGVLRNALVFHHHRHLKSRYS